MAMNISEASAVNVLVSFLCHTDSDPPTPEQARDALAKLAAAAHDKLAAGVSADTVTNGWATDDRRLALWFDPQAVRESFEGDDEDPTAGISDEQLRAAAHEVIAKSDHLWQTFHDICSQIVAQAHA